MIQHKVMLRYGDQIHVPIYAAVESKIRFLGGAAFSLFGCKEELYAQAKKAAGPVALGSPLGDNWYADFEREEGALKRAVVIGPIMVTSVPRREIENLIRKMRMDDALVLSLAGQQELLRAMERCPVVTNTVAAQYALMLHFCLTGEKIGRSDSVYLRSERGNSGDRRNSEERPA